VVAAAHRFHVFDHFGSALVLNYDDGVLVVGVAPELLTNTNIRERVLLLRSITIAFCNNAGAA
jgi:hypothetical protein